MTIKILFAISFGIFLSFLIINMLLGCDSWDQELWSASNSCLTPMEIYKTIVEK